MANWVIKLLKDQKFSMQLGINGKKSVSNKFTLEKYLQEEAPKIYQYADAYITMSYQDNCPTAVLEAMATGLPILYSSSGGVPELVGKDAGLGIKVPENWYKTKVPEKFLISNGMKEIIENKRSMSQASRTRAVEFFDIKDWINKHKMIFEKLLEKN